MTYAPTPIDSSHVRLPDDLLQLTELLARNAHDIWARQRLHDGWEYGPERDDTHKRHPCLVPYELLPESEKEYDRQSALATLGAIVALKYDIRSPARTAVRPRLGWTDADAEQALGRMTSGAPDLPWLLAAWERIVEEDWVGRPKFYELLGGHLLKKFEPVLSCDVLDRGLGFWPKEVRLRQLHGQALATCGAILRANAVFQQLLDEGNTDGDTFGGLGRTEKELALRASTASVRKAHLKKAHNCYFQGYQQALGRRDHDGAIYNGINAAAIALWSGAAKPAAGLAAAVDKRCPACAPNHWTLATQAEAALILSAGAQGSREWARAVDCYTRAAALAKDDLRALCAMRRQARAHLRHFKRPARLLDDCFGIPNLATFVGHMIDSPNRAAPRLPEALCEAVKAEIKARLRENKAGIGYASAACGSDLLFLEAMLESKDSIPLGGEIHVVLPFPQAQFRKVSVTGIGGEEWGKRFDAVLAKAPPPAVTGDHAAAWDSVCYDYCAFIQTGLALLRAQRLDSDLITMAVWDGRPGDAAAGTHSTVRYWRDIGQEPIIIDPVQPHARAVGRPKTALRRRTGFLRGRRDTLAGLAFPQRIMAVLLADVYRFGALTEKQIPLFVRYFLGEVAKLQTKTRHKPIFWNTWGDALFYVFEEVGAAGLFALELRDMIRGVNWEARGLPGNLSLRIALHAGPVYSFTDPIIRRTNYMGTHVNRAARLEPQTPPGEVYASEAFAALVAATGTAGLQCEYVGQVKLAKEAGLLPTYHVRGGT